MTELCDKIEKFGKGVGNNSRFRIVEALFNGPLSVNELTKQVKQSQPAVSQHLKVLKQSGIVLDSRNGKEITYSLDTQYILGLLKSLTAEIKKPTK